MKPSERINEIAQKESGKEYPLDRDWLLAILKYLDEEYEKGLIPLSTNNKK